MKKKKTKIISGCVFLAAFAAVAALVLIKTGVINVDKIKTNATESNLNVFLSEPFGERNLVSAVYEFGYNKNLDDCNIITCEIRTADGKYLDGGNIIMLSELQKLSYNNEDIPFYSENYSDKTNQIAYSGFFVPMDCVAVYVGEKKYDVVDGEINTTKGKVSFRYCTMTIPFEYSINRDYPELSLIDEDGKKHVIENPDTD